MAHQQNKPSGLTNTARPGRRLFAAGLALSAVLPLAGVTVAAGLIVAATAAHAQAPDRVAKVRVRVYLTELRSLWFNAESGWHGLKGEPYFTTAFQGETEPVALTLVPPVSIKEGTTNKPAVVTYPSPAPLLDAVVTPGTNLRGGINFTENDGDYDWGKDRLEQTRQGAQQRAAAEMARNGVDPRFTAEQLKSVARAAMPIGGGKSAPVGSKLDTDDHLAAFALDVPVDGPRSEDRVLDCREPGERYSWRYQFVLRIERQPLREDGSPILGPAAPPAPSTPDTGIVVGGDFKAVGDSGFAARVDRVRYGASVNDSNVAVTVTYRNITPFARKLKPEAMAVALMHRGDTRQDWAGKALTWPGPGNAPTGAVPPGEQIALDGLCTTTYSFPVGDGIKQEGVERLRVHEPKGGAPQYDFALARYKKYTPPMDPEPSATSVKGLRQFAGKYRTSEDTIITVRAEGKYLTATGVTEETSGTSSPRQAESWQLGLQGDNKTVEGIWNDYRKTREQSGYLGRAKVVFSPDGNSFKGSVQPSSGFAPFEYTGTRIEENNNGGSSSTGNNGSNGSGGVINAVGGFVRIDDFFAIRIDSFRRRRADQVEAVVTARNVSARDARLDASSLTFLAEAAESAAQFRNIGNLYAADGETPQRLPSSPVVQKNQEVQIRYVFASIPESITQLKRMTVRGYGGKTPATFDLSGYSLAAPQVNGGSGAPTLSLKYYDVTLNELRRNKGGDWEAVLSVRNAYASRLGLTPGEFQMFLIDADGESVRNVGNLYKASVTDDLVRVTSTLYMETGDSVRVRLHFAGTKGMTPTRFRIGDGITKTMDLPPSVVK
jgi:hypothetical protein